MFSSEITRRHQRTRKRWVAVLMVLALIAVSFFLANFLISRRVVLEELDITIRDLPAELEQYSILHISDLHGARFGEEQKGIKNVLGDTRYSCVVMTGDMLGEDGDVEPLLELIRLMPHDVPKYLIPGDTDGSFIETRAHSSLSVYTDWAEKVQAAGVILLDKPALITREKGRLWLVPEELYALDLRGMQSTLEQQADELGRRAASLTADDAARMRSLEYEKQRIESVKEIKKEFTTEDVQVVLTHTPLSEDYVADMIAWSEKDDAFSMRYASLILAGHYNGGQWRIPFVGAIYVPELGWLPKDNLIQGLSYLSGIPQYISPGMGSDPHYEHQPGRIFNNPVITKITLTRKAER